MSSTITPPLTTAAQVAAPCGSNLAQGAVSVMGRVALSTIFILSAVGNKIPHFDQVAGYMATAGVPLPRFMLAGAIVFLLAGGVSVILGYKARIGAALLITFLVLATYYFHAFWTIADAQLRQDQTIQFMKNLALIGGLLTIVANGPGRWSCDQSLAQCGKS